MGKLDGKVAIVTGAGGGIGQGIALALAKEGASLTVVGRNLETLNSTVDMVKALGAEAIAVKCDVGIRQDVDRMVAETVRKFGSLDILVNNAQAASGSIPLEKTSDEDLAITMNSGFYGVWFAMQAAFPHMSERGGKIINFGSNAAVNGLPGKSAYAAAKEAVRGITRVAATEWGQYKINVNVICPIAATPGVLKWQEEQPRQYKAAMASTPMRRFGDSEKDIGRVVVFLASDDSGYITGQTIMVDGGQTYAR